MSTAPTIQKSRTAQRIDVRAAELESWPLDPASILQGAPKASGLTLSRSHDRKMVRGIWACTPGAFRWVWTYDETLTVLEGEAIVELADGRIELKPGDLAYFERGQSSIWRIRSPLKKTFHAAADEPLPF
jgi:uncharacterized cupin superfamily protein